MIIKHDYKYIGENTNKLIKNGYGEITVHSIHFNRYYSDEEKENNLSLSKTMTNEQWNKYCEELRKFFNEHLTEISSIEVRNKIKGSVINDFL